MAPSMFRKVLIAICSTLVNAHMQMSDPFPLRSPLDPSVPWNIKDYSMTSPLNADGSNFPCKGYQLDTQEVPKAQYSAGQSYTMSIEGGAGHLGGSCQLSLSYDNGQTFHVIKSIIGGCAAQAGSYDFTIPSFAPSGLALFAWSWMNFEGNREYYMNCAVIQITGQSTDTSQLSAELPNLFVANLASINSCVVPEGTDAVFPHPGCDVEYGDGMSASSSAPFSADCDNNSGPGIDWCSGQTGPANTHPIIAAPGAISSQPVVASVSSPPPMMSQPAIVSQASAIISIPVMSTLSTVTYPLVPPPPNLPYAAANPQTYLPCQLGTFLCSSSSTYYTCVVSTNGETTYGTLTQPVPGGMMCQPGAGSGAQRNDQIVRLQSSGWCGNEGSLKCVSQGTQFQVCTQGAWVNMGPVAPGTKCVQGKIVGSH